MKFWNNILISFYASYMILGVKYSPISFKANTNSSIMKVKLYSKSKTEWNNKYDWFKWGNYTNTTKYLLLQKVFEIKLFLVNRLTS